MKKLKKFVVTYNGKSIKVQAISGTKAIFTAAKIFAVKPNKVSVTQQL